MKSFLEEYGFAILAAIVVILLIAMATPVGNLIKEQVMGMVNKFSGSADKKLDASVGSEFSAMLAGQTLMVTGPSSTNQYTAVLHYKHGNADVTATLAGWTGNDTNININTAVNSAKGTIDANSDYYVVVTDKGTNETFTSNVAHTSSAITLNQQVSQPGA